MGKKTAKVKKMTNAQVGIPPRHLDFNLPASTPKYFYDNNATATTFFAMLSAAFPPGELFFMESVRNFRSRITAEKQKAEISGFMGQEAIHTREHVLLNEMLADQGFEMKLPDLATKAGLGLLEKILPHSSQLAATTFMEHFTALLAEQLLTDKEFSERADPEMIKLWQWHALEELEHKMVAYDVYELIGNNRLERMAVVVAIAAVMVPAFGLTWGVMLAKDGQLGNVKDNVRGLNLLLGRKGFVTRILPRLPDFLKRDFHPSKHNTKTLEQSWKEKLFGDSGELVNEFKNRDAVLALAQ